MFELLKISEYIYEGVVEPSYKQSTMAYATRAGHSRQKRLEATSSQTHSTMGDSSGEHRKLYADCLSGKSKICLIHGPRHYSAEWKVLGDFGAKYDKGKPTKAAEIIPCQKINLTDSRETMPFFIM